jgi:hypothetical protein
MEKRGLSSAWVAMLTGLIASGSALAMGIRENRKELDRSAAGTLYEVRADGPEGGGALTYRVQGKATRDRIDFVVSSDFSPGDGSQPQTVSPDMCRQRLDALRAELGRRRLAHVTVHPDGCGAKDRNGLVTAKP